MLGRICSVYAEERSAADIHHTATCGRAVKSPNQSDWVLVAVDQASFSRVNSCGFGQAKGQDLTFCDRPFVTDAWEFSDRQHAVVIDDGALRTQTTKGCATSSKIG